MNPEKALRAAIKEAELAWGKQGFAKLGDHQRQAEVALQMLHIIIANSENQGFEKAADYALAVVTSEEILK